MCHATAGCDKTEDTCRFAHRKPRADELDRIKAWQANREAKAKAKPKAKPKAKSAGGRYCRDGGLGRFSIGRVGSGSGHGLRPRLTVQKSGGWCYQCRN